MTSYPFTKSPVDIDRLALEIRLSIITVAYDHCQIDGADQLSVAFKDELSETEQTTLSAIVAAHTGQPLAIPPSEVVVSAMPSLSPFAAKAAGTKKFYKRVCGIRADLVPGDNEAVFTIGFPWVKITGMEIVDAGSGDVTDFLVLDTEAGMISGHSRYVLNQFGFGVNISPVYYSYKSEYDADLYYDMQIKCIITTAVAKNVGINFILNEVK